MHSPLSMEALNGRATWIVQGRFTSCELSPANVSIEQLLRCVVLVAQKWVRRQWCRLSLVQHKVEHRSGPPNSDADTQLVDTLFYRKTVAEDDETLGW